MLLEINVTDHRKKPDEYWFYRDEKGSTDEQSDA